MNVRPLICLFFLSLVMTATAETKPASKTALATFGGGCFWCTEAVFELLPGVKSVVSGYAGGKSANPTYEEICTGRTGHAEVIQIEYDPAVVTYEKLVEVFFEAHDPTTLNRQGADEGTQYRSVIFWHDEAQHQSAVAGKKAAQAQFDDPIVTEISALPKFYPAEKYHQDYFKNNPNAGYCTFVIKPKVKKLQGKGVIGQ
jgi:peptide-methionine (S)-S-oxide reductase